MLLVPLLICSAGDTAFAQGSIFGTVQNADLSNPAVGQLFWVGFLDNTDEEIRIESNVGAGYDGTNWFDDFQNYSTEVAGNAYDYIFVNTANGQAFQLGKLIPANSFQQEDVVLATVSVPLRPTGLVARVTSTARISLSWNAQTGVRWHVYRRATANNSVFRRLDDPTGNLASLGVVDSFFVDATSDGTTDYTYIIIGDDGAGNYSAHSVEVSALASAPVAPIVAAVNPDSGSATGQPTVTLTGTNFDVAGASVTFGGNPATSVVVVSPFELTCAVPVGTAGFVDVVVTNTASALASAPLVSGFRYLGNAAPVLAAIGPQSVDEGQNLNFGVSATDVDADSLILSAVGLPLNATFTDNFNGTGTFDFNPDFTQSGVHNVTIIASDGVQADSEVVAITVNHVNLVPVLTAIGPQSIDEGQNLNVPVSATDPDADSLILSAVGLPLNATFTDNFNGTGTLDFNPDFTQAGVYNVTVIVSDGALADSEVVAITVNDVNRIPVLTAIGPQSVDEGQNLTLPISGSDPDADSIILSALGLPASATFTDNFNGTGTFDFNPDFTQSGVYNVTFIASDGVLADSEVVAITVNHVNLVPVLAAIGPQSVAEGANLNVPVSATDPDADSLILSAVGLPLNATFTDNFNGTGAFDFNPDFTQAGVYNITFIASDGVLADSEVVAVTVSGTNQTPVLAAIGPQSVNEGQNLNVPVSGSDPDADSLILSAVGLPLNATFTDNFNGTGIFDFNPDFTQSGVYNVTFIASDGILADSEVVAITVNHVNLVPVLAAIGPQSVDEGQNLNVPVSATDPDADSLILSAVGLPLNATFTDNFNGTGTLDFNPDFTQSGVYNVTFIASDGALADSEVVAITVNHVNRVPVLAAIGSQSVAEGANLNVPVSATDPDGDSLILSTVGLPLNATFADNFNGTGTFDFNPDFTQEGVYNVTFIASDGVLADSEIVAITVFGTNQAPVLTAIGPQSVDEGQNLALPVSASDPDADSLILSAVGFPTNATFTDNFDGTGTFNFNPDFLQAGVYNVTFIASDGIFADSEVVAITVNDVNRAPTWFPIGAKFVDEGQPLQFSVGGNDLDGDSLILTAQGVPVGATFTDSFDWSGFFDWTPTFLDAGVYNVTFIVSDGALADTEVVAITVNDVNRAPTWFPIGAKTGTEGLPLQFSVGGNDLDADSLILTAENLPAGATFIDSFDWSGFFDWTPDFLQAGVYNVTFIVSDGVLADTEVVAITINDAGNQAPVLAAIGPQGVAEGANLNVPVSASDVDLDSLILSAVGLPANAIFTDNFDGTGTLDFNPDFTQAGVHNVTIIASDGLLADSEVVAITVTDAGNQAPILAAIGPQGVTEGLNLNVPISGSDPDLDSLIFTAVGLPANAMLIDNFNNTATLDFNPDFTQAGVHNVTIIVSDGALADSEVVAITVADAGNQSPVLAAIGPQTVDEGQNLNLPVSATDPDADSLILSAVGLPLNATFTDNFNGTGTLNFNPDFTQSGIYNVTVIASDGVLADSEIVAITVNHVNLAPVLAPIGAQIVAEGFTLNLPVTAADSDADSLILAAVGLPLNATFVDNFDGTGTFDFNPDFTQAGIYNVTFIASDGALADSEVVAITVNDAGNQVPLLAAVNDTTIDENTILVLPVSATDPDLDSLILSAAGLPTNATFVDNFDGTGSLSFSPSFFQAGAYPVTIIASDGLLADSALVTITVNNVNQLPILTPIGPQTVIEGDTLEILISASDADGVVPVLAAQNLPVNAIVTDSGNGTGSLFFTPLFNQAGLYQVLFTASDGVDIDSELVDITVTDAGNLPPVLSPIGNRVVAEGNTLAFRVTASDADSTIPVLSAVNLPLNATFVDSLNGAGGLVFSPNFNQGGNSYLVTFIASDGVLADSEVVLLTVGEIGNLPPVFDSVGPQTVAEGDSLIVLVHATDPEMTQITMGTMAPIENGVFYDSGNGYGTLKLRPDFYQSGVDTVRILALDGNPSPASAILRIVITITETNVAPILKMIGDRTVLAGDSVRIRIVAHDSTAPPGSVLFLSTLNAPLHSSFADSGNGIGGFVYRPTHDDIGVHQMTFIATDNGTPSLSDLEVVILAVQNQNRAPILNTIGTKAVDEGDTLVFLISASDPDGTIPFLTADSLPANATFVDSGNGIGSLRFTPSYLQAGLYQVYFKASDGLATDKETVLIQVREAGNQSPQWNPIPDSVFVLERDTLRLVMTATDPELQTLTLSAAPLVDYMIYADSGSGLGALEMVPDYWQDGFYTVQFVVTDSQGAADTAQTVVVVQDAGNQVPFFLPVDTQFVVETQTLNFTVTASDTDRTVPSLAARPLPLNASFTDNTDGTGAVSMTPDFTQQGAFDFYVVAFDAEDITLTDSILVTLVVLDQNRTPEFDSSSTFGQGVVMREGDSVTIWHHASDRDGTIPIMSVDALPSPNMTWADSGNGFIWLTFVADFNDRGSYTVRLRATDATYDTSSIHRDQVFTVGSTNVPPELDSIPPQTVMEGQTLEFIVTATDPNATIPTVTAADLPVNSSFAPLGNGQGRFTFTPSLIQSGVYYPVFRAADFQFTDSQRVEITVVELGNQSPAWLSTFPTDTVILTVFRGENRHVFATDPDNIALTLSALNLPLNATFVDSTNMAGLFTFMPDSSQIDSSYTVTFVAADTSLADTAFISYKVLGFTRGDWNYDGVLNVLDVVPLVNNAFKGGPDPVPFDIGDINKDGIINVLDVVQLVNHVFRGGPPPPL